MYQVNFNPFSTFQEMARTSNHYEKKWLMGDNSVTYRVGLWFLFTALPFTAIYLFFCTFQDMAQTGIHYETKMF